MKKLSVKKLSLLGLVLVAASAVTAAVLPSKSDDNRIVDDGTHTNNSDSAGAVGAGNGVSCTDDDGTANASCDQTLGGDDPTATTASGGQQESANGTDTASGQTSA